MCVFFFQQDRSIHLKTYSSTILLNDRGTSAALCASISRPTISAPNGPPFSFPRSSSESGRLLKSLISFAAFRVLYFLIRRRPLNSLSVSPAPLSISPSFSNFVRALSPRIGRIRYRYLVAYVANAASTACTMTSLYAHLNVCYAYVIARTWSRGIGAKKFRCRTRYIVAGRRRRSITHASRRYTVTQCNHCVVNLKEKKQET